MKLSEYIQKMQADEIFVRTEFTRLDKVTAPSGITFRQLLFLHKLYETGSEGITPNAMAKEFELDPAAITRHCARLTNLIRQESINHSNFHFLSASV